MTGRTRAPRSPSGAWSPSSRGAAGFKSGNTGRPRLATFRGPTRYSNWALQKQVLQGAYPGSMDDRVHRSQLTHILRAGVTTFVCLQAEFDPYVTEMEWRRCQKLRPYFGDSVQIVRQSKDSPNPLPQDPDSLQFVYFPIVDQNVAPDKEFYSLLKDLYERLKNGEIMYVHCWGGHGRAGSVAACLMAMCKNLSPQEALGRTQKYHDTRLETADYGRKIDSPQRPSQRAQVRRMLEAWRAEQGKGMTTMEMDKDILPRAVLPSPNNGKIDYKGTRNSYADCTDTPTPTGVKKGVQQRGKPARLFVGEGTPKQKASTPTHSRNNIPARFPSPHNKSSVSVPSSPTNVNTGKKSNPPHVTGRGFPTAHLHNKIHKKTYG